MTLQYFTMPSDYADFKAQYRRLAMRYHPDVGGSVEIMQIINAEYDYLFPKMKDSYNAEQRANNRPETHETPQEYKDIISALLNMGVSVELCGTWLWISGDTKPHKDRLKSLGCTWSPKKQMWSWKPPQEYRRYNRTHSMAYIRTKYGSQKFTNSGNVPTT